MQTRCYSICRRCAAVYPEGHRCPACEGDTAAAAAVAAATTHAVELARDRRVRPTLQRSAAFVAGIVTVSVIAGVGMLVLAFV